MVSVLGLFSIWDAYSINKYVLRCKNSFQSPAPWSQAEELTWGQHKAHPARFLTGHRPTLLGDRRCPWDSDARLSSQLLPLGTRLGGTWVAHEHFPRGPTFTPRGLCKQDVTKKPSTCHLSLPCSKIEDTTFMLLVKWTATWELLLFNDSYSTWQITIVYVTGNIQQVSHDCKMFVYDFKSKGMFERWVLMQEWL